MSFSAKVKEEISRQKSPGRHCQIAELLALVLAVGEVEVHEGQGKLILKPENALVADKLLQLVDQIFSGEVFVHRHDKYMEIDDPELLDRF